MVDSLFCTRINKYVTVDYCQQCDFANHDTNVRYVFQCEVCGECVDSPCEYAQMERCGACREQRVIDPIREQVEPPHPPAAETVPTPQPSPPKTILRCYLLNAPNRKYFDVTEDGLDIGKNTLRPLVLPDDERLQSVSREHCRILKTEGEWSILQLSTYNRTAVDDELVTSTEEPETLGSSFPVLLEIARYKFRVEELSVPDEQTQQA